MDERAALKQLSAELAEFDRRLIGRNRVLLVDDEPVVRQVLRAVLDAPDLDIVEAGTAGEAVRALAVSAFNLLLTDKNLPDQSGVELMRLARDAHPQLEVILMTAYPSVETALSCIDLGAYDYLLKPFDDITVVAGRVRAALARQNRSYRAAKLVEKLRLGLTVTLGALSKDRQLTEVGRLQGALRAFDTRAAVEGSEVVVAGEGSIAGEARAIGCRVKSALSLAELRAALSASTCLLVVAELPREVDVAQAIALAREVSPLVEAVAWAPAASNLDRPLAALAAGASEFLVAAEGSAVSRKKLTRALERQAREQRTQRLFDELKALSVEMLAGQG